METHVWCLSHYDRSEMNIISTEDRHWLMYTMLQRTGPAEDHYVIVKSIMISEVNITIEKYLELSLEWFSTDKKGQLLFLLENNETQGAFWVSYQHSLIYLGRKLWKISSAWLPGTFVRVYKQHPDKADSLLRWVMMTTAISLSCGLDIFRGW